MIYKLRRHKSEKQKKRDVESYVYIANQFEHLHNIDSYDLCDIYTVKCKSKIFDFTAKLDIDNFEYFKPYDYALERDSTEYNLKMHRGAEVGNLGFLRDDPPDWSPESTPSFEIMQMKIKSRKCRPKIKLLYCKRCRQEFEKEWFGQVYCSEKCRVQKRNR